jgi:flagellin
MTDSAGKLISTQVNLTSGETRASAIESINTALKATNNDLSKLSAVDLDSNLTDTAGVGTITLMGGSGTNFQVYAAADATGSTFGVTTNASGTTQNAFLNSAVNGSAGSIDILNAQDAQLAVAALGVATSHLGAAQATVGKGMNTVTYAMELAQSQDTNEAAAESQIRDANMAQEAANLTKAQILVQAGTAALAQANSAPQQILSLLKG